MTNQEAIDILVKVIKTQKALDMAIKVLEQEPKRGKWIDDDPHHHKYHRCSCCGIGEFNWGSDNYCRNCGARMESDTK